MQEIKCNNPAAYRFTWPGRDESFICYIHAPQLLRVAEAMGMPLQMIPVHESDQEKEECRQVKKQ